MHDVGGRTPLAINDRAIALLTDLISLQTVNPMGRPYPGRLPVERPVVEYLERLFAPFGVKTTRQSCAPFHESLLMTIPGQTDAPGSLFESHIDTVPADDWSDRAFAPCLKNSRIYGRGACDDKGSLSGMVLALLQLLESGRQPPQTVWLLAAGDEEHGQTGIRHLIAAERLPIGRGIFGEPTQLVPVIQHKGTIRWDITVRGKSAHTSQAELGHNAILETLPVITALARYEHQLRATCTSPFMSGPSLTVTMIQGGRTRNMVPDACTISVDFRILPGMDRQRSVDDLFAWLSALNLPLEHSEFQCFAPALSTSPEDPFVASVIDLCRDVLGRTMVPAGVPYGSDAGWLPEGIPAIVLGPGSIAQAHAVDEYVETEQVVQSAAIYYRIMAHDWTSIKTLTMP